MNKLILHVVAVVFCLCSWSCAQVFFDDFDGDALDGRNWLVAEKAWGGDNGGVVHDNVSVSNGFLFLEGHGDSYTGSVHGVDHYGQPLARITRVGAAIATSNYFASGRYEVCVKLPLELGACSAFWTFHYEEAYKGTALYDELQLVGGVSKQNFRDIGLSSNDVDSLWIDLSNYKNAREPYIDQITNDTAKVSSYFKAHVWDVSKLDLVTDFGHRDEIFRILQNGVSLEVQGSEYMGYYMVRNHEIDIEIPTALKSEPENISYTNARFNAWVGECGGEFTDPFVDLGRGLNDGAYHILRFDWHSGSSSEVRRVEYYVDGECLQTNFTHVPDIGGRFWLGLWFPAWAGSPAFDMQQLTIDWVRITPFDETGDRFVPESFPNSGWWTNQFVVPTNTPVPTVVPTATPIPPAPPVVTPTPIPASTPTAVPAKLAVKNDFDGDGRSDIGCYDAVDGHWALLCSRDGAKNSSFGYEGTVPLSGDFDGDGMCDFGCYFAPGGNWYVFGSQKGFWTTAFGYSGTIPVSGDFDGDKMSDFGCYFPPTGDWYIFKSSVGFWTTRFGYGGTVPVTGDFDGDGICDFGCYYPPSGNWYFYRSRDGFWNTQFGYEGTVPVTGDFDGDGCCDFGCYYPKGGHWYVCKSARGFWTTAYGYAGTLPVVGDYDGDGLADYGCYDALSENWLIHRSREGNWSVKFGLKHAEPLR